MGSPYVSSRCGGLRPQLPAFCRSRWPAPTPSFAPMPPLMQGRLHPSHHFQSDEQQKHVIPCSCTSRLGGSPRSGLPQLERHADLSSHNRRLGLFERLGGLDQREQLLFKDIVRSNVLTASSALLLGAPTDEELTLGDAWLEVFQQALPRSQFCAAGKLVARAYREEFKEEPPSPPTVC